MTDGIRGESSPPFPEIKAVLNVKKLLAKQQVRFLIAGSLNTALDFLFFNLLTLAAHLPQLVANTISVSICICISYLLNHFFVFQHPTRVRLVLFLKFFAVTGFSSLVIQNSVIFAFESFFNTQFGNSLLVPSAEGREFIVINVAKVVAVLIGLVWNFLMYKFVVFRRPVPVVAAVDAFEEATPIDSARIIGGPEADPAP